jgi:hypothetical protein
MSKELKFYGLMYVSARSQDGAYLQKVDPQKRIEIYLKMALRLAKGVYDRFGLPLNLVTNNEGVLAPLLSKLCGTQGAKYLTLVQVEFATSIPDGARYFSATHKILLFDYFARQSEYSMLLDLDMICLGGAEEPLAGFIRDEIPLVYEISDQVIPAHGFARIYDDLNKFGPVGKDFRWFGGEFIAGNSIFFRELSELAMAALPRYQEIFQTLHHQGDEIITTYCLNQMQARRSANIPVNIGGPDIVRRHHGKKTLHDERRLGQISNIAFLHMPTIKSLLSSRFSDATLVRLLIAAELLPRRSAGLLLAAIGAIG